MSEKRVKEHHLLKRVFFFLKFLEIRLRFIVILIITALVVGYWDHIENYYERWQRERHGAEISATAVESDTEYYCSMHPFVVRDRPGKCPICGMPLTPRKKGTSEQAPGETAVRVQASPQRVAEAGVEVQPAEYRLLTNTIRAYGTVEVPEGQMSRIIARFPGRVEELKVDAVGAMVKKGQPLARIYTPKYLAGAQEYQRALANVERAQTLSSEEQTRAKNMLDASRRRLELAGFTAEQIEAMATSKELPDSITLYSPLSGVVLEKSVLLGDQVEENTPLYTIADLSKLWVQVKALESDIGLIKVGMPVEITSVSSPNDIFYGTVDLINPALDKETRSVNVRVVVDNAKGKLKPQMYTQALIEIPVGRVEYASGSGKSPRPEQKGTLPTTTQAKADSFYNDLPDGADYYICPMHPNVVSDKPGACGLCEMDLVKTKKEAGKQPELPTKSAADAAQFLASLPADATHYECPMHAEVVSNKPGECPVCNMALVEKKKTALSSPVQPESATEQWAEGYACPMHIGELSDQPGKCRICNCGMETRKWRVERVLSVPESAVIDAGTRRYVYVETTPGVYEAREVTLGTRAGDYYPVIAGLSAGEKVVNRGAFLIDAEARLGGK